MAGEKLTFYVSVDDADVVNPTQGFCQLSSHRNDVGLAQSWFGTGFHLRQLAPAIHDWNLYTEMDI